MSKPATKKDQQTELLHALNAAATSLQRSAHSEEDVFRVFREQVVALRLRGGLSLLDEDGNYLIFRAVALPEAEVKVLSRFERLVGLGAEGYRFNFRHAGAYGEVMETGQSVYEAESRITLVQILPEAARPFANPILAAFGALPALFAPLTVEGKTQGVLEIFGERLAADDLPAVEAFANHLAIALSNARAVSKMRESEARYRGLFDHMLNGFALHQIVTDAEGRPVDYIFLEVNPAFERLTGLRAEAIIGKRVTEALPGIEYDPFIEIYGRVALTGEPVQFEQYATSLNKHFDIAAFSPRRGQFAVVFTDITERKQAEDTLHNAEERYHVLFEQSPNGKLLLDMETGKTIEANETAYKQLGYTREEFAALRISDYEALEKPEETAQHMQKIMREGSDDFETLHRTKSGEIRNVHVWAKILSLGDRVLFYAVFQDITEHKQAEEASRHSRDLLNLTGQMAQVGGWEWNVETQTLYWTEEVYRIHEVDPATRPNLAEAIAFYAPESQPVISTAIQAGIDSGTPWDLELQLDTAKARRIWVRAQGSAERRDGRTVRLYGAFQDITERKQAEEKLRLQATALNTTANAAFITDRAGVIQWVNPAFSRITGFTAEQAVGRTPRILKSGLYPREFYEDLWRTILAGDVWQAEMINRHQAGYHYTIHQTVTPLRGPNGEITHFVAIQQDITERVLAEAALEKSQRRLKALFDNTQDAILLADDEARYVDANPAACALLGYSREELLRMTVWDLTPLPNRELSQELWRAFIAAGQQGGEYTLHRKDGTTVAADYRAVANIVPGLHLSVIRDITERKQAEETLRESESALQKGQHVAHIGSWAWYIQSKQLKWSDEMFHIFGYEKKEFTGDWIDVIAHAIHPEDRAKVERANQSVIQDRQATPLEYRIIRPDGSIRVVWDEAGELLLDEKGEPLILTGITQDITERIQAEQALRKNEQRLQVALSKVNIAVFHQDRALRYTWIYQPQLGYSPKQVVGHTDAELLPPEAARTVTEIKQRVIEMGESAHEEVSVVTEGVTFVYELVAEPLRDASGEIIGLTGATLDITERKQAENRLNYHARLLRHINDAVIATDDQFRITAWNRASEAMYGWNSEEVLGRSVSEILSFDFTDEQRKEAGDELNSTLTARSERVHRHRDGRMIYVETNTIALTDEQRRMTGYVSVNRDVTERKKAEDSLRASEERYRSLFEDTPIAIWEEDFSQIKKRLDGLKALGVSDFEVYFASNPEKILAFTNLIRIVGVNRAALRMYRADSEEQLIDGTENILSKGERQHLHEDLVAIAEGRTSNSWEGSDETLTGEPIEISLRWTVTPGHEQDYSKVIVSTIDITDQKRAEAKVLVQFQRLNALRDIDRAITSIFDLRLSLNFLISRAVSILEVDAAAILLVNMSQSSLEYVASMGFRTRPASSLEIRLGEGYAGRVALERETLRISNLAQNPNSSHDDYYVREEGMIGYFGLPLVAKGNILGVLEVFQRREVERDAEWLDFLESLAEQAAIAIDNVQSFEGMQRLNLELIMAYDATIEGWSHAMDLRDKETEGHTQRVTEMTLKLAKRMGMDDMDLIQLRRGGLLHDIGKLGVPDSILFKPGALTEEEWQTMKQHPSYARDMLMAITYLRPALDIPYCHHEKWDGTGYPQGLRGDQIPLAARIFAVVDVWDALTSDRPYRPAWTEEKALDYIREQSGKHFDPPAVEAFLNMIAEGRLP